MSTAAPFAVPPLVAGTNVWTAAGPGGGLTTTVLIDPVDSRIVYAGSTGGVFKSTTGGARWNAASRGMTVHPVQALAIDPRHHQTVYAAAGNSWTAGSGVWASRDGASTWETLLFAANAQADFGQETFGSVAVDPAHPGAVYAASNRHLFVSRDDGRSWRIVLDYGAVEPNFGLVGRLAADPARASVFALVASTVFTHVPYFKFLESADGGESWLDHSAALPDGATFGFSNLAIEPTSAGTLYLAGSAVFRSRDGGKSWQQVGPSWPSGDAAAFTQLAAGPGGIVLAGNIYVSPSQLFKSLDGGTIWAPIVFPPVDAVVSYTVGASPDQIYAAVDALGVMVSRDGGATWRAVNAGLQAMPALAVAIDPQRPANLFTVGEPDFALRFNSGLLRSGDGGGRWTMEGALAPPTSLWGASISGGRYYYNPNTLFVDPAQPTHLYYGSGDQAVASTDAGATWTRISTPENCQSLFYLSPEPSAPSILYSTASVCPSGCKAFKSVDGGATWSCLVGLQDQTHRIVVAPSDPDVLYAVSWIFGAALPRHLLWKSADAGATWTAIGSALPLAATLVDHLYLAVDPRNARRIFVSLPQGVWESDDGGAHWTERDHGLPHGRPDRGFPFSPLVAVDPNDPSLVYAAAANIGVYRSRDGGRHWQPILAGLPPLNPVALGPNFYQAIVPDPLDGATVYLATYDNGLLVYSGR